MSARGAAGATGSITVSLGAIFAAIRAGHWGSLAFAGSATALIAAGAWVYAVASVRRARKQRLAAYRVEVLPDVPTRCTFWLEDAPEVTDGG